MVGVFGALGAFIGNIVGERWIGNHEPLIETGIGAVVGFAVGLSLGLLAIRLIVIQR